MSENDYTRWAESAEYMAEEVLTLGSDAPDPDMSELIDEAEAKIRQAQQLAEVRA